MCARVPKHLFLLICDSSMIRQIICPRSFLSLHQLFERHMGMVGNKSDLVARFEATVATGLESIAQEEIIEKLGGAKSETQKGRVIIETDRPVKDLLKLKTINNLFVIVHDSVLSDGKLPQNGDELESLLTEVADDCDWELGLSKWIEASNFRRCSFDHLIIKDPSLREIQPSFRISSNRYGPSHKFTSPEICTKMGSVVDAKFGWPIKMKGFDLEIYTNISENHLYVTLTLTPISLACRNIIQTGYTTLRAATCYALLRVAKVETGDIVLDPMAGSGAIPVENMVGWNELEWFSYTLASDLTQKIISKSKTNMSLFQGTKRAPPCDAFVSDATKETLRDNSIDVIVSDLPFGRRHGSKTTNRALYARMLNDVSRIARLTSGRAVFLTQDFRSMNLALDCNKDYWTQKVCNYVKVGNLDCWIYLFNRTDKVYKNEKSNETKMAH